MSDLLVSIRHARPDDAAGLSQVFDAAWREAYLGVIPGVHLEKMIARRSVEWWRRAVARGRPLAVLDNGDGIAGYASYGRARDTALGAEGEIDELYLAPEYQGIGFGGRLFRAVRNDLKDRGLDRIVVHALAENRRACTFYERLGGRAVGRVNERLGGALLPKIAYLFV